MHWSIYGFIVVSLLVASTLLFTDAARSVVQLGLIWRVAPYEQPGGGAGSILVIGDSTGYGTGAARSEDSVAGRLGNEYTWYRIQNDSVNGRRIAGAADALEKVSSRHDLILLQIGANDLLADRDVPVVVADMRQLIESARNRADFVVVMSAGNIGAVPYFTDADAIRFEAVSRQYDQAMQQLARDYQDVSFVSLFDEPADDPFVQRSKELLSADGLHPYSAGYAVWYEKARPDFTAVLNATSTP